MFLALSSLGHGLVATRVFRIIRLAKTTVIAWAWFGCNAIFFHRYCPTCVRHRLGMVWLQRDNHTHDNLLDDYVIACAWFGCNWTRQMQVPETRWSHRLRMVWLQLATVASTTALFNVSSLAHGLVATFWRMDKNTPSN